jgi:preprotein translocase subunit Sec61beta
MAKDNRIMLPSSMGGLVRYTDEETSKIEIKPGVIIVGTIAVAIVLILLNIYGSAIFGI